MVLPLTLRVNTVPVTFLLAFLLILLRRRRRLRRRQPALRTLGNKVLQLRAASRIPDPNMGQGAAGLIIYLVAHPGLGIGPGHPPAPQVLNSLFFRGRHNNDAIDFAISAGFYQERHIVDRQLARGGTGEDIPGPRDDGGMGEGFEPVAGDRVSEDMCGEGRPVEGAVVV